MAKADTANKLTLTIQKRSDSGRREATRLRNKGLIPGIIYGKKTEPLSVMVQNKELSKLLRSTSGEHGLLSLKIEGESADRPALVKTLQHDPVSGHILHVDFHAIALTDKIRVPVRVDLKGEPVGVKQDGGILEHFLREVEVECLPTEIPGHLEYDISAMIIGSTIHVRDLAVPPNVKIITDSEGAIASVQKQKEEKVEEAAALTEPEVIREKKEEEEGEKAEGGESAKSEAKAKPEAKTDEKTKK